MNEIIDENDDLLSLALNSIKKLEKLTKVAEAPTRLLKIATMPGIPVIATLEAK